MLSKLSVVSDISISLENVNTLAILGDNGVGKTAFLEKIALVDEKNLEIVVNARGYVKYKDFPLQLMTIKLNVKKLGVKGTVLLNLFLLKIMLIFARVMLNIRS